MKNYVKPELFYESYELSQSIAACGWDMANSADPTNCMAQGDPSFGNPDVFVFTAQGVCDEANASIVEDYGIFCYENGGDNIAMKIFNS